MTKQEELYVAQQAFSVVLRDYRNAEKMMRAMSNYIWENSQPCTDIVDGLMPSNYKLLRKRYAISIPGSGIALAWYLLEKYFEGKLEIKE